MVYRLIFLSGAQQGRRITVEQAPMVIGRSPDAAIILDDNEVALRHAVIEHRKDGLHIADLGTMNRILVNGREVRQCWLKHGDEVEIGRTRFLVQAVVPAEVGLPDTARLRRRRRLQGLAVLAAGLFVAFLVARWLASRRVAAPGPPAELKMAAEAPAPRTDMAQTRIPAQSGALVTNESAEGLSGGDALIHVLPVAEELRSMRADLLDIREKVQELVTRPASSGIVTAPLTAVTAEPPALSTGGRGEFLESEKRAESMLQEARELAAAGKLAEADRVLASIQQLTPDFLPAYEERALVCERRGLLGDAMEQWLEIIDRTADGTLYEKATAEYLRLERMEAKLPPLGRLIHISSLEQQRFQESDEFAEMRVLNIGLAPSKGDFDIDAEGVTVEVFFFDRDAISGAVVPARVAVPRTVLRVSAPWQRGEEKKVVASYVVKKGPREREPGADARTQYYGYVVRVFYHGELQDEDARPKGLLRRETGKATVNAKQLEHSAGGPTAVTGKDPGLPGRGD